MAASWRPFVCPAFDELRLKPELLWLSDNPPPLLGVRAGCYETGFKVFRHLDPCRFWCKPFYRRRKISTLINGDAVTAAMQRVLARTFFW